MILRIVLVSPMHAANVGAVARLCGNFAVDEVFIVEPRCDVFSPEAYAVATSHAHSILEKFERVGSLRDALADCETVIGFSRRVGDMRRPDLSWAQLGELSAVEGRVCLVFGPEDTGLSQDDLTLCSSICALPTHPKIPSLNLSQAVAVVLSGVLWQSSEHAQQAPVVKTRFESERPLAAVGLVSLVEHWRQTMIDVGLTRDGNPDRLLHYFHRILSRAQVSEREGNMLRGFLSQVQIAVGSRKTKKESEHEPR